MFLLINGSELKQNYRDARKTTVTNVLLIDVWKFKQNYSYANTVWIVFCFWSTFQNESKTIVTQENNRNQCFFYKCYRIQTERLLRKKSSSTNVFG